MKIGCRLFILAAQLLWLQETEIFQSIVLDWKFHQNLPKFLFLIITPDFLFLHASDPSVHIQSKFSSFFCGKFWLASGRLSHIFLS
jgi:hypothetical protein